MNLPKRFHVCLRFCFHFYTSLFLVVCDLLCCSWPLQAKLQRDKKWSEESFWLRTVNLRESFTEDKFSNLYDVKAQVDRIYSLALENNMEQSIISEWQQHVILLQSLVDSFKNKSHRSALKHLKKVFGSSRGLNEENTKLMDSILREAQREEPVVQQVVQASPWHQPFNYNQGPRFTPPQFPWHPPQQGTCNICQLPGHFARECPAQRNVQPYVPFPAMEPFRPPQGGRNRGRTFGPRGPPRRGGGRGGRRN